MSGLTALAAAPAVYLLFMIYKLDKKEKEPVGFLAKLVGFGALTIIPAAIIELIGEAFIDSLFGMESTLSVIIFYIVVVAGTEEFVKFIVLFWCTWNKPSFNCRFDGVVYAVFVSLGFALLENVLYVYQSGVGVGILRALTAVPLHCAAGIYMGEFYGNAKKHANLGNNKKRRSSLMKAYFIPVLLHGVYDCLCSLEFDGSLIVFFGFVIVMYIITIVNVKTYAKNDEFLGLNKDAPVLMAPIYPPYVQPGPPVYPQYNPNTPYPQYNAPYPQYGQNVQYPQAMQNTMGNYMNGQISVVNMDYVMNRVKQELFKTNIYLEGSHAGILNSMLDLSRIGNREPKIQILNDCARLFSMENGNCIFEYRTNSNDDIVFYMLDHVIGVIASNIALSAGNYQMMARIKTDAFVRIGGFYEHWFKCGRNVLNMRSC